MKKFFVITSKTYNDNSVKIGTVVQLDTKDLEKIKEKHEVEEFKIETTKTKTKKK